MSKRTPRIEVVPIGGPASPSRPHFWRLIAANGETVCHSESYTNRRGALRGARSIARIAAQANVEVVEA